MAKGSNFNLSPPSIARLHGVLLYNLCFCVWGFNGSDVCFYFPFLHLTLQNICSVVHYINRKAKIIKRNQKTLQRLNLTIFLLITHGLQTSACWLSPHSEIITFTVTIITEVKQLLTLTNLKKENWQGEEYSSGRAHIHDQHLHKGNPDRILNKENLNPFYFHSKYHMHWSDTKLISVTERVNPCLALEAWDETAWVGGGNSFFCTFSLILQSIQKLLLWTNGLVRKASCKVEYSPA